MLIIIHKYSWRVGHFRSRINYYPNSIYCIYTHPKVSPSYIHWSNNLPLARQQKASSFYIYFFRPQLFFPSIFFRYTIILYHASENPISFRAFCLQLSITIQLLSIDTGVFLGGEISKQFWAWPASLFTFLLDWKYKQINNTYFK